MKTPTVKIFCCESCVYVSTLRVQAWLYWNFCLLKDWNPSSLELRHTTAARWESMNIRQTDRPEEAATLVSSCVHVKNDQMIKSDTACVIVSGGALQSVSWDLLQTPCGWTVWPWSAGINKLLRKHYIELKRLYCAVQRGEHAEEHGPRPRLWPRPRIISYLSEFSPINKFTHINFGKPCDSVFSSTCDCDVSWLENADKHSL